MWRESIAATGYSGAPPRSGDGFGLEPAKEGGASFGERLSKGDLVLGEEPGREATVAAIEGVMVGRDVLWLRFHSGTGRGLFHCEDEVRILKQFAP